MIKVQEVMTRNPVTCSTETKLPEVARLMVEFDCGEIPLFERGDGNRVVGVITDRDITCRAVAGGSAFSGISVKQIMTSPPISVRPDDSIERAVELMAQKRVRRLPVLDARGVCIGMVSESDIAQRVSASLAGDLEQSITTAPQLLRMH